MYQLFYIFQLGTIHWPTTLCDQSDKYWIQEKIEKSKIQVFKDRNFLRFNIKCFLKKLSTGEAVSLLVVYQTSSVESVTLLHSATIIQVLLAGEIWFWANFRISFALAQHSQEKNENHDCYSTPRCLQRCGLKTSF